ncbi:hypothetical protein BDV23DRAFT_7071 [Aspergillus alliaceus]|uniref:Uncharacterized protein n=1 Tax=Petromyces alliaceus TaxID=209559 RepID=A0A5N7BWN6_PETAA|nr:hypothetical protein BDV23DRAFT_7071 [Aspergillus alliaceus]
MYREDDQTGRDGAGEGGKERGEESRIWDYRSWVLGGSFQRPGELYSVSERGGVGFSVDYEYSGRSFSLYLVTFFSPDRLRLWAMIAVMLTNQSIITALLGCLAKSYFYRDVECRS